MSPRTSGGQPLTAVDVEDAGEGLSRLVERAMTGDDVTISKGGMPVARIVRLRDEVAPRRRIGMLEGQISTTPDCDDPLPDHILAAFEGR